MAQSESLISILWSTDGSGQGAVWIVLGAALVVIAAVYLPLLIRLVRLFSFERGLRESLPAPSAEGGPLAPEIQGALRNAFADSPAATAFAEFERRWSTARLAEADDRAPIRLADVFEDRPLLPDGPRRSLLPVLPGLFLGLGVFAALAGLIPSLQAAGEADTGLLAAQLGGALRAMAWGVLLGLLGSLSGRLLEGGFQARAAGLDALTERAFGSVSPGELAEITRHTQQQSLETLGRELSHSANELNERMDRGLQRIEQSTSRAASLVSQEQRGALHTVVQELSLSVRQGVDHHLSELRGALQRATEHQASVTTGLSETFDRMAENSQNQDRVARTLLDSATAVDEAARTMRGSANEMQPVLDHLGTTSRALSDTADRIADTQTVVSRTAEGVRSSLEHAASGVDDQRQFIERSLGEIRRSLVGLGDGLGDSLQRSLREVDDVLGGTIGQLRDTLAESNETIERLSGPVRAAEGTTRETHVALDRMRSEVEALGQWMNQAVKPLRSGLGDVENRAEEISRAIGEFANHARQIDKTMESLREEIHDESRRLQGAGSELGRKLSQTTDAMSMLETATTDAARRTRSTDSPMSARRWAPSPSASERPQDRPQDRASNNEEPATASRSREIAAAASMPADDPPRNEPIGRDLGLSGYRMGTPKAKGPDPYARFDEGGAEAKAGGGDPGLPDADDEQGLREDLKLSGLLGPSAPGDDPDPDAKE